MAAYRDAEQPHGEDAAASGDELLMGEGRELFHRFVFRRSWAAGLGILFLAGTATLIWRGLPADPLPGSSAGGGDVPEQVSAHDFLNSRILADTVADAFEVAASQARQTPSTAQERADVKEQVHSGFKAASERVLLAYPKASAQLHSVMLGRPQQGAVLRAMSYMADPRVQSAGQDLMQDAVGAAEASADKGERERLLVERLQSRDEALRPLSEEIFPALASSSASGSLGGMRIFKALDNWNARVEVTPGPSSSRRLFAGTPFDRAMIRQLQSYFDVVAINHGVPLPNVADLDENTVGDMVECVSTSIKTAALVEVGTCITQYFADVMDYVKTQFGFGSASSTNTDNYASNPWGAAR